MSLKIKAMKSFYWTPVLVAMFVLVFSACSKSNINVEGKDCPILNLHERFLQVGEMHNEGVDCAYIGVRDYFSETKTQNPQDISKEQLLEIALSALEEYCGNSLFVTKTTGDAGDTLTLDSEIEIYFERIKSFFNENSEITSAELINELNAVNHMASLQLSDTLKKAAVFSGTATCYSSYNYWKENHKKWIIALNYPELLDEYTDEELNALELGEEGFIFPETKGIGELWQKVKTTVKDWWNNGGKEIVFADGEGAAIGAMTGVVAGGVGASPVAVAGGAYASISEAIDQWKN